MDWCPLGRILEKKEYTDRRCSGETKHRVLQFWNKIMYYTILYRYRCIFTRFRWQNDTNFCEFAFSSPPRCPGHRWVKAELCPGQCGVPWQHWLMLSAVRYNAEYKKSTVRDSSESKLSAVRDNLGQRWEEQMELNNENYLALGNLVTLNLWTGRRVSVTGLVWHQAPGGCSRARPRPARSGTSRALLLLLQPSCQHQEIRSSDHAWS